MARAAVVLGIAGAVIAGWIVAPVADIARRGTLDERTVRAWRREGRPPRRRILVDARIPDPRCADQRSRPLGEPTGTS
jgi:hypothetical protein